MRLVRLGGVALGVVFTLLLVYLLTLGTPPPKPKAKVASGEVVLAQGVKDAFEYAKAAQAILDREPKYARVYFVPSAATASLKHGKVVVMGELAGEPDLLALQLELAKFGVAVPVEWQVSFPRPDQ